MRIRNDPFHRVSYMGFLVRRTAITFELVIATQCFGIAEVFQATGD